MLIDHVYRFDLGHALRLSLLGCLENGYSTRYLDGRLNTDEFTQVVIDNIPAHLQPGNTKSQRIPHVRQAQDVINECNAKISQR